MPATSKKSRPTADLSARIKAVDDVVAEKKESAGPETVAIPFRGREFTVPKEMDEWETEACLAMSTKDYVLAAKLLLGPYQWAILQSLGSKRRDVQEFLAVFGDVVSEQCVG